MDLENLPPYFGHISYLLVFISFAVRRIFWLRLMAIVASMFTITYSYYYFDSPHWIAIQWNAFFILINIFHLALLTWEKRDIRFSGDKKFLYQHVFKQFSPGEFEKVMRLARPVSYGKHEILIEEGKKLDKLFILASGKLGVRSGGHKVGSLSSGQFAGEMSFLTGQKTKAIVWCEDDCRLYYWNQKVLKNFLERYPKFQSVFQANIGSQLIDELMRASVKEGYRKPSPHRRLPQAYQ